MAGKLVTDTSHCTHLSSKRKLNNRSIKDELTNFVCEQDDDDEYVEELEEEEFEFESDEIAYESEEEEDDDDDDDEIKVSNWIDSDGTTVIHGVEVINHDSEIENSCGFDVCSICFKPWNSQGEHRICCLPCGHIYGLSCIKKWLLQHETSRKCPQCNASCTSKDVTLLYATRLCLSHHKEASTTRFPFTIQGFNNFTAYVSQRRANILRQQEDVSRLKDDVFTQVAPLSKKLAHLLKQRYHALARRAYTLGRCSIALEKQDVLERRANALQQRADVLGRQVYALEQRCDSLDRRANALERRWHALYRLLDSYNASVNLVMLEFKDHKIKVHENNTNTKH